MENPSRDQVLERLGNSARPPHNGPGHPTRRQGGSCGLYSSLALARFFPFWREIQSYRLVLLSEERDEVVTVYDGLNIFTSHNNNNDPAILKQLALFSRRIAGKLLIGDAVARKQDPKAAFG